MNPVCYDIMRFLRQNPRSSHMEIAKSLGIPRSTISQHIAKLKQDQWVRVIWNYRDARKPLVELTEYGFFLS